MSSWVRAAGARKIIKNKTENKKETYIVIYLPYIHHLISHVIIKTIAMHSVFKIFKNSLPPIIYDSKCPVMHESMILIAS
jgi:hypothetical protein